MISSFFLSKISRFLAIKIPKPPGGAGEQGSRELVICAKNALGSRTPYFMFLPIITSVVIYWQQ